MIDIVLELLVDFGLLRKDFRHHKKITKKEKEDGRQRPFQKYFLKPSVLVFFAVLFVMSIGAVLFFTYQRTAIFPEKTKKELSEIANWTEKWKETYGHYPESLEELIENNPVRAHWKTDAWNRPYKYAKTANGKGFLLISAGLDGQFETEDDIGIE